jgi:glycosyltransferase involved in cell wall biosynthesis
MAPKSKKLIFIIYSALDRPGGRENWIRNTSACLDNPTEIICYQGGNQEELMKNIKIKRVSTLRSVIPYFNILAKASLGVLLVLDMVWFIAKTFRYAKKHREDYGNDTVFIAMNSVIEGSAALLIKKALKKKVIISVRGKSPLELSATLPYLKPFVYWIEKKVLRSADGIWANGFDTADYIKQATGKTPQVIPNGVDFAAFSRVGKNNYQKKVTIMSLATLREIKGIPQLIKAIPKIKESTNRDFEVIFAGFGNPQKYLHELQKENCNNLVEFLGPVPSIDIIGNADVVACLSGGSGMSMTALEAMAAGKAIVAWDSPVYQQLLKNGKSALLVPEGNIDELAQSIIRQIENPKLRSSLGKEAQKEAKNYDWVKICDYIRQELVKV